MSTQIDTVDQLREAIEQTVAPLDATVRIKAAEKIDTSDRPATHRLSVEVEVEVNGWEWTDNSVNVYACAILLARFRTCWRMEGKRLAGRTAVAV